MLLHIIKKEEIEISKSTDVLDQALSKHLI